MTQTVLQTTRFGELVFDESQILHLSGGLIGIPDTDRVLVVQPGGSGPLYWLQSADDARLAIVVADLGLVASDYRPVVSADDLSDLELTNPEDALVLGVCVLSSEPGASTVNLRAPLIVNPALRRGLQLLLDSDEYPLRHPLSVAPVGAAAGEV